MPKSTLHIIDSFGHGSQKQTKLKPTHTKSIREDLKSIANTLTDFKVEECIETSHMITFLFKAPFFDYLPIF